MVTLETIRRVLPTLDAAEFKKLADVILKLSPEEANNITKETAIRMALYEWLIAVGITEVARRLVLKNFDAKTSVNEGDAALRGELALPNFVTILDSQYAIYRSHAGFLSLSEEKWVQDLPQLAVTRITCDITALWIRLNVWLNKLTGGKDAWTESARGSNSPSTDERRDVRNDAACPDA